MTAFNPAIHAAHRRARPRRMRGFTRLVLVLSVLVVAYLGLAAWLWFRQPTIAFDPVQRLQQMTPHAAAGQAAWPKYREAMPWTHEARGQRVRGTDPDAAELSIIELGPADPAWEDAAALVNSHQKEIAALREATKLRTLGYVPQLGYDAADAAYFNVPPAPADSELAQEFPAFAVLLPQLSELRIASRIMRLDALAAAQKGEGGRATEDLLSMLRMSQHAAQVPVLVSSLVGYAISNAAVATTKEILDAYPDAIRRDDLIRLDAAFAQVNPQATALNMQGEQLMADDVLQRIYSDDGAGGGSMLPARCERVFALSRPLIAGQPISDSSDFAAFILGPVRWAGSSNRGEVRRVWMEVLTEAGEQSLLPAHRQIFDRSDALQNESPPGESAFGAYFPVPLLIPAISHAARLSSGARVEATVARTRIAAQRFKHDNGRWPAALTDLVPKYLPAVPMDEFTDAPLQFDVKDGKPRVWSAEPKR